MTTKTLKYYFGAICLCSNLVIFAQTLPGNDDNNGGLENSDPVAPIDGYIWALAAIGLVYVFWRLRAFALQYKSL